MTPDPEGEILQLQRQLVEQPRSTMFVRLAEALRMAGRIPEALAVLRRGEHHRPDHIPARVVLARIHLDLGHPSTARAVLADVVRTDPGNVAATALLASLYVDEARASEARVLLERLAAHGGEEGRLAQELGERLERVTTPPRGADPFDLGALADNLAARGARDAARRMWRRIDATAPGNPHVARRLEELDAPPPSEARTSAPRPTPRGARALRSYAETVLRHG